MSELTLPTILGKTGTEFYEYSETFRRHPRHLHGGVVSDEGRKEIQGKDNQICMIMQHEKKNFVYLHRSSQTQRATSVVRNSQSDGQFFCSERCDYNMAVYQPRAIAVMVFAALCEGLSGGKWHIAFSIVPHCSNFTKMKHTNKTTGKDPQSITFMADWLDFTQHLSNAQVGRLLRCLARFERGQIDTRHVAELRKDAAVGVAYNFITDQISRRTRT